VLNIFSEHFFEKGGILDPYRVPAGLLISFLPLFHPSGVIPLINFFSLSGTEQKESFAPSPNFLVFRPGTGQIAVTA
jgi:hypothetical protein